ncbi:unnamed protein product [Acanthoscelides obtectus]|uniref:Uncharacterized protein n=1 Tax=Acanthoscelides obtectus TaxID=200917 RepID=A0A9P0LBH8_ACAOB|nr:unnamed protein product [Acanthoscelides obtectus]CAK1643052.1 hypothetical protein AOBTE_LOCUS13398 [Acanthoscelides obtectus]
MLLLNTRIHILMPPRCRREQRTC